MPADQIMATLTDDVRAVATPRAFALSMAWTLPSLNSSADTAKRLGFDSLLALAGTPGDPTEVGEEADRITTFAQAARQRGLRALMQLCLDEIDSVHPLAAHIAPQAFSTPPAARSLVVDPRMPVAREQSKVMLRRAGDPALLAWWRDQIAQLLACGVDGFAHVVTDRPGAHLAAALAADGAPFVQFTRLHGLPQRMGNFLVGDAAEVPDAAVAARLISAAALMADGWAVAAAAASQNAALVTFVNGKVLGADTPPHTVRFWTGPADTLLIGSRPVAGNAALVLVQNRGDAAAVWPPVHMPAMPWQHLTCPAGTVPPPDIAGGETWLLHGRPPPEVRADNRLPIANGTEASGRVIISRISPSVDGGLFAIKRVQGEAVDVEADIFSDGHDLVAASLLTRAADDMTWTRHGMVAGPNDVFRARVRFDRLGRHEFAVEAWRDVWGNFTHDFEVKHRAGQDLKLERREAALLIEAAIERAKVPLAARLRALLARLETEDQAGVVVLLLAQEVTDDMAACDARAFMARSFAQPVQIEREAARFSSWYELFPRSQSPDPARHGTLRDVAARLPHIAAMGFDTLYFPPIHPIGEINRKGRNNTLTPAPDDVGSPYAIGSAAGGHASIHPELGTISDFRALVAEAAAHGLEIALDFAIQCAPDHPWLKEHPGWFAWRPDGTIKYAENPPKKYQDIVNVDFYAADAVPGLWIALRDVVLLWAAEGVRSFRVDNPHTKPLPFWQWMIAEVKARYPDTLFLSEAFTRPKPMYHLAKVGFSQSYTYFTWRNTKEELTAYFTELAETDVKDYFRPHLFVNTPDINPLFLQSSGRAGFLIRAALAATLSGLWGVYAGFELCESAALPGREEYLDSEKFEIRHRPDRTAGDIVDEIAQLNRLRRQEPALQSHLGVEFHNAFNDHVLYYSKALSAGDTSRILVHVSLDPAHAQSADFEVPFWCFGLADSQSVAVEDLLTGRHFTWHGKMQHIALSPERPYAIWRIHPLQGG